MKFYKFVIYWIIFLGGMMIIVGSRIIEIVCIKCMLTGALGLGIFSVLLGIAALVKINRLSADPMPGKRS